MYACLKRNQLRKLRGNTLEVLQTNLELANTQAVTLKLTGTKMYEEEQKEQQETDRELKKDSPEDKTPLWKLENRN